MSKSSKSLSPAKAERRRKRAEQAAGRSAIVKAGLRVEKFHPWVVGLMCSSFVFGVLFVLGEQSGQDEAIPA